MCGRCFVVNAYARKFPSNEILSSSTHSVFLDWVFPDYVRPLLRKRQEDIDDRLVLGHIGKERHALQEQREVAQLFTALR